MLEVRDAWGRNVADLGKCARCGAMISNIFVYRGQTYGSECIKVVTGQPVERWVVKNGVIDEQATAEREARRLARLQDSKDRELQRERQREQNKIESAWLVELLQKYESNFCLSIANDLAGGLAIGELPIKARIIIAEIFSKGTGRRNSDSYKSAFTGHLAKLGVPVVDETHAHCADPEYHYSCGGYQYHSDRVTFCPCDCHKPKKAKRAVK